MVSCSISIVIRYTLRVQCVYGKIKDRYSCRHLKCIAYLNCFQTTLVLYWRLSGNRINSKLYPLYIVGTILVVPVCYGHLNYHFIFEMRISVCPWKYKFQIHKCLQNTLRMSVCYGENDVFEFYIS